MADGDHESTVTTRPDPTERVNQSIKDAVSSLRSLFEAKIEKNHDVDQERFKSIDAQLKSLRGMSDERVQMILDRIRTNTDIIKANAETITDKIKVSQDTAKAAVEAAFAAAGAAADKQEKSFIKLLDTLGATVNDLKDRIVVMEGKASIANPSTSDAIRNMNSTIELLKESRDQNLGRHVQSDTSTGTWIAIVAALAALALVVVDFAGIIKAAH